MKFTVTNTCVPTAVGIRATGCELKLVGCDADTLQMDAAQLKLAITERTRAVVPVHLYGACPDMEAIASVCREAKGPMVEDCAQAHGASWAGKAAGRWGIMSAWSFYPSKNLGAYGDGGAVATDDAAMAQAINRLRNYGQRVRYHHDEEGRNSRLDEIQAAILRAKLGHLSRWNEQRRALAAVYDHELAGAGAAVRIPMVPAACVSACHLYPVRVEAARRDAVRDAMQERGVATQIHYPVPIHRQKAYAASFEDASFPAAEAAAGELLTLPLFPQMTPEQARQAAAALVEVLSS